MLNKHLYLRLSGVVPLILFTAIFCSELSSHAAPGPQPPCGSATFPPYPDLENSPAVRVWGPRRIESRLETAGLHRLELYTLHVVGGDCCAFSPYLRSRGLAPACRGNIRTHGHSLLVHHPQAMEDACYQRLRFVGGGW